MAISYICGFEMGAAGESFARNGSPTWDTGTVHSGTYSARCNASSAQIYFSFAKRPAGGTLPSVFQSCRFYIRIGSLPAANCYLTALGTQTSFTGVRLRLDTTGTLSLVNATPSVTATSSNTLSADGLWHRVDWDVGWNAGAGMRVFVDGVQWASDSTMTISAQTFGHIGVCSTTTADIYLDDVVWYDAALPVTLSDYNVGLLLPVSDSAAGGWTRPDGTTTTGLSTEVDNVPPTGNTSTTNTTGGHIANTVNSSSDNYDALCATYGSIVAEKGEILAVQAITNDAQAVTTGSPKSGAVVIVSNPSGQTESSFDFGIQRDVGGSLTAAAMGTFPVGWGTHVGPISEKPAVDLTIGPVVRVGKRTATTRQVDVDFLGVYVMWASSIIARSYVTSQAVNRAGTF